MFLICTIQMASYALLNGAIDGKHRARLWENGKTPNLVRTRGPSYNWMIHPDWVDRYVHRVHNFVIIYNAMNII